ncbi:TOBE domain-containing protein [Campylobacter sp. RM16187]|uniref:TOBE domain-containing protein n=1 Tax=Campylobacter sp. RM16187 TaxID=1660063 RepID=UPI0021B6A01E|nr:hypothetical protein [Campylobacter sp. RM16187]QKG30078.1 molybdenum-pterin binding domain-containing protein [Campylobacter sp. RM16187]
MIKAQVSNITGNQDVNLFEFTSGEMKFYMLGLENLDEFKIGDSVKLAFKSSDVIIATTPLKNCSLTNEIKATISNLTKGNITSVLHLKSLNFEFESIITTKSCRRLNLKQNDEIYAYVKATSLYISDKNRD